MLYKEKVDGSDYPDAFDIENDEKIDQIVDFVVKLDEMEEMQSEVDMHCRRKEDILEFKTNFETM